MKKLLTLLFALAVAFSLSMPAFAQEAGGGEAAKTEKKEAKKKAPKAKKEKKEKKTKEEKKEGAQ